MTDSELVLATAEPIISSDASLTLQKQCAKVIKEQAESVVRHAVSRWASSEDNFDPELSTNLLASIFAFRELDPVAQTQIILHPTFRYWVQAMRRTSRGDEPEREKQFARSLVDFVWYEQVIEHKLNQTWTVWTDDRGGLRCSRLSKFIEFGREYSNKPVDISPSSGGAMFSLVSGEEAYISADVLQNKAKPSTKKSVQNNFYISDAPLVADDKVEIWARDPWLRVDLTGTNQRTTGVNFFGTKDELYFEESQPEFYATALNFLKEIWIEQYEDLLRFTHVIVPMLPSQNVNRAFTVSSRQGAIFVDAVEPHLMVENLIHENAHIKLRQIQLLDRLIENPSDESQKFSVPWRPDPRPIPGIFEGLWVFTHIAEFRLKLFVLEDSVEYLQAFEKLIEDLGAAHQILSDNARLTIIGQQFLEKMGEWINNLKKRKKCNETAAK
jgi:hypothetical protein